MPSSAELKRKREQYALSPSGGLTAKGHHPAHIYSSTPKNEHKTHAHPSHLNTGRPGPKNNKQAAAPRSVEPLPAHMSSDTPIQKKPQPVRGNSSKPAGTGDFYKSYPVVSVPGRAPKSHLYKHHMPAHGSNSVHSAAKKHLAASPALHRHSGLLSTNPTHTDSGIASTKNSLKPDPIASKHLVVHQGDTLWGIAKKRLGSGSRWHELHTAKGSSLTEKQAKRLQPGTQVYLSSPNLSTTSTPYASLTPKSHPKSTSKLSTQSGSSTFVSPGKLSAKPAALTGAPERKSAARSTPSSLTSRRNSNDRHSPSFFTTSSASRNPMFKRESGTQRNSRPSSPALWAGLPVLAGKLHQGSVSQVHHVAIRVGIPLAESRSGVALAREVRGATLVKPPLTPVVEAFGNAQVRGAAKGAFKALVPVGLAIDAVQLRSAWKQDHGFGPNARKVAVSSAGGWVGAAGGVELGAAIGSLVPGVGTVIGALIGGMAGSMAGSKVGEEMVNLDADKGTSRVESFNSFSKAKQYARGL